MTKWFGLWWRQLDPYDELSSHLRVQGLAPLIRATIAAACLSLALLALGTLWSATGPRGPVHVAFALASCGGATVGALLWMIRWPTRGQAILYALLCNASIVLSALAQREPNAALLSCTTFAILAGYIAIMHGARLMTYNFVIAAVMGAIEAVRLSHILNVVSALCAYALVLLLNLAVPLGIQAVVHVLGAEALLAERDQLTGLLTRRGFSRRAETRLEQSREQGAYFVVTMIDLDRFKQLNDNCGHRTGDEALVSVSRALSDNTDDTAVIGRSGGEEFVIADIWHPEDVGRIARQLCDVIAVLPFGITASIGTAGIHPAYRTGDIGALLTELIAAADGAMYVAKRNGGNQAGHHRWPLRPPLDVAGQHVVDSACDREC